MWQPGDRATVKYGLWAKNGVTVLARMNCYREMYLCKRTDGQLWAYAPDWLIARRATSGGSPRVISRKGKRPAREA